MELCLCDWFEEDGPGQVHADDVSGLRALNPYGKVFCVRGSAGEHVVISYGNAEFRVRPGVVRSVEFDPGVAVGDEVKVSCSGVIGRVCDVHWHHKKSVPILYLEIDGKRKSRRYELMEIERL